MAPKTRDMNPSGLGRAIINRKVKDSRKAQESGLFSVDVDSSTRLKSITQERDLDEFLSTAELAGTEFTAERRNVKIIQQSASSSQNPYLLTEQAEKQMLRRHEENKQKLRVPRRPAWTKKMTTSELDRQEKAAFLDWRRGIAELQEKENFLLTPFERNIEVWRQLWRVLERSHLVVQIVDARNPLRFRCEDLESYVHDVEGPEGEAGTGRGKRRSMLLINKSDLLTAEQRRRWADYFDEQGIKYAFYSAANANALQLQRREEEVAAMESNDRPTSDDLSSEDDEEDVTGDELQNTRLDEDLSKETDADSLYSSDEEMEGEQTDERTKILSVLELEELLLKMAPDLANFTDASGNAPSRLVVGLVGYPNVGKSSTINSLLGEKKVSVSSTPGKTKHFQTIHLSDYIVLCDCPGLVFPQFATTKAELICDGVLPIDQMREYTGPVSLLVKRIPKEILEATYGISIRVQGIEEGGSGYITAESFLIAYAIARGYMRSGQGNPDEARAARYILKDYVNGKLLFCHSPPGSSEVEFNKQTHKIALSRTLGKKKAPVTRVGKDSDTYVAPVFGTTGNIVTSAPVGSKSLAVDDDFFQRDSSLSSRPFIQGGPSNLGYTRNRLYPHQNAVSNDGTPIDGKQAQLSLLVENRGSGKKHHKKMKRVKQRSGKGYD